MLGARKVVKRAGVLILALALIMGITLPAFAQAQEEPEQKAFSGIIVAINLEEGSITVKTEGGKTLTLNITKDTKVRLPAGKVQGVFKAELEKGDHLSVLTRGEGEGELTVPWIQVKPERPQVKHITGVVISISIEEGTITIVDPQGNEHTIKLPKEGIQNLEVGKLITSVVKQAEGKKLKNPVACAAVSAEQIQERVTAHAKTWRERAQAEEVSAETAEEHIKSLIELMEANKKHVRGVLSAVLEKVPEPAKAAIERAREQAMKGFERAKEAIQQQGPPEGKGKPGEVGAPEKPSLPGKPEGKTGEAKAPEKPSLPEKPEGKTGEVKAP